MRALSSVMVRPSGQVSPDEAPGSALRNGDDAAGQLRAPTSPAPAPPEPEAPAAALPVALPDDAPPADAPARNAEIQTEHLRKAFGEHIVLAAINLRVSAGDIVAIVGSSGSGKTVMLDCLTGLVEPTSGRVLVADHDAAPDESGAPPLVDLAEVDPDRLDRIRLHWAIVFQKNALFSGSVYDNIALWLREHTGMSEGRIRQVAVESLKAAQLDVGDVMNKDRDALSGGMAKRVAIARAIAIDPAVIFYDEPTTGLDPINTERINHLIRGLKGALKVTSIVVGHQHAPRGRLHQPREAVQHHRLAGAR